MCMCLCVHIHVVLENYAIYRIRLLDVQTVGRRLHNSGNVGFMLIGNKNYRLSFM
jgi:hypothetical protein